jgi:general secretion pathway protein A
MYLNFYNLVGEPFGITPDPAFLFLSPTHKEAVGAILYGIEMRKGFVLITGEVGTGKTTVVRSCLQSLDREEARPVYIFDPNISFKELLKIILKELQIVSQTGEVHEMVQELLAFLIREYRAGRNVVLVLDEAQNTPIDTLENLRLLSNLETSEDKLIQIVLVGQPELETRLARHELRQLRQRIAVRATLRSLSPRESMEYVRDRLSQVTPQQNQIFTARALDRVIRHSKGIPRVINILCDNALIAGYGYQKNPVSLAIVREVIADYEGGKRWRSWHRRLSALVAAGSLVSAITAGPCVSGICPESGFASNQGGGMVREQVRRGQDVALFGRQEFLFAKQMTARNWSVSTFQRERLPFGNRVWGMGLPDVRPNPFYSSTLRGADPLCVWLRQSGTQVAPAPLVAVQAEKRLPSLLQG